MRQVRGLWLVALMVAVGCGDDDGPGDAGRDASSASDAGDAGAGRDAAAVDGGSSDAGSPDTGAPDADVPWPDAGGLPAPDWAPLTVGPAGSCPEFVPCGGDVVGVWDVSGGCFEVDIESAISRCPGAMVTRREGRGRGRVVFGADGIAHRVAVSEVEADVFFPALCAAVFSCEMLEAAMASLVTEASCGTTPTGDCECTAVQRTTIDDTDAYRVEGDEIVGTTKRWEFCIAGDTLTYRDSSPSGTREPGVVELSRAD